MTSDAQSTFRSAPPYTNASAEVQESVSRFDDFFGLPSRPSPAVVTPARTSTTTLPPPYGTPECPAPAYDALHEPSTVARYFFKYGFLFPPFWIVGVFVLFMKLEPIPESECGKTAAEQVDELAIIRRVELKWARRCLLALLIFLATIASVILSLVLAHAGPFARRQQA